VVFKKTTGAAFNLGTDFFITNWPGILGLTVVLAVIYSACFAAGVVLIYLLKFILVSVVRVLPGLDASEFALIHFGIRMLTGLILWLLLAGLNVFFNTSLILLFLELITPIKTEEKAKAPQMVPAPAISS
jgi:hypothetical protein